MYHLETFCTSTVVFVFVELETGSSEECLNVITQLELRDGCVRGLCRV